MIAGIIGATGYAGAELARLLAGHPKLEKLLLSSVSFEGDRIENVYPNFLGRISSALLKPEEVVHEADLVFAALPSGVGEGYAKAAVERKIPFIDLSADFRFDDDEETFNAWYGKAYVHPELREFSVYGLPELNRRRIRELAAAGPVIIGNPGCYPTGASLGLFPALAKGLAASGAGPVIVDSASGITGGGREPQRSFHFPECSDSVSPYKVGAHRHTPEISRNMEMMAGATRAHSSGEQGGLEPGFPLEAEFHAPSLVFTPHLAPMNRGILSTIYIPLKKDSGIHEGRPRPPDAGLEALAGKIRQLYLDFYRDEPFVRILPAGLCAATNRVRQSNYCDISVHLDHSGSMLIVVSAIDNMVKGAAGQAVQNMNLVMGFEENSGLAAIPALF
ncbi:MAG: N-acetyl-gamma-glutamyl-phosphate reductase [Treponema sp.]|jgi:N-acetyl-gamma-glutamyl-phosphate reductase|nr:N-acetyl-gamma-glutamyl-phosphate reductase [Treponema sp.]